MTTMKQKWNVMSFYGGW